jgi:hypothetical protein
MNTSLLSTRRIVSCLFAAACLLPAPRLFAATSQTITFNAVPAQVVGSSITVSATASSGLPVTFALVPNGNCSISGNTVTFLNTGNCGIVASQAGNATYAAAQPVGQIVVINQATLTAQTITFGAIPSQIVGGTLTVSATASSGLAVTFTVIQNGNCGISGNTVTFLNTGNCGIVANQAGNATYAAAQPVGQIVVVNSPTQQTLNFPAIPPQTVGTPLTLTATASSGLAITYSSSTNAVCTVSGATASFFTAGSCTLTAAQSGNNVYAAAPSVAQTFNVTAASTLTAQTITFSNPGAQTIGAPIALTATASSGLPVTLTSSTPTVCALSGTAANFLASGTCTLTAAQPGNTTYAAATSISQSFNVTGTAAPVSAYFTICQAQPTTGTYCTDANPGPADGNGYHSLPYWTNLNKTLASLSVADNQVWGVDRSGVLWLLPNFKTSTTWTQVATNVTQVSAGHNLVCQLSGNQHVLCANPGLGSSTVTWFDTGATNLKQIAASAGKQFWAVDINGNLIQVKDYTQLTATSTTVASGVTQVAVDGRGVVCQINSNQSVYCSNWSVPAATANPAPYHGLPWVQANTQLQNIAVVEGQVLGTDATGNLWLLQDWANSATWFKIAFGGAGTVMAGASVPSQYLPADFALGEVPVLLFMGQSNSVGYTQLIPRFISPTSPNVWGVQNAGWNYLPGNQNGTSPQFTNTISSITSVQWTNFNVNPTGADMDLGYNFTSSGSGPGGGAANFAAYQWQGLINAGWPLPDLYVVHIAWPGEGLDPTANQGSTAGVPFATHGLALWQPTLTASQQPSYALAPFARTIVYRALQNLLAAGKTPRLIGLQWNQWETDAEFAQSIADAPTNYNTLFSGLSSAIGTSFPVQLVRPLSTAYGTTQLAQMQTVFYNLVANDPTDFSLIDISTVSPNIFSGGIFGGGDGSIHYNFDTHNWFAHQAIGLCLLNANCGTRITTLPASPPN